jgi:protein-tyrosine phosphatase
VSGFVDVHSHVVPSGDDGVASEEEGLSLVREAGRRGTRVLYATPHVWPLEGLDDARERSVRRAHARMAVEAARAGVELRLGFELTPAHARLRDDPCRYALQGLRAVLVEVPFRGGLESTIALGTHVEAAGFVPVIAHPERSDATIAEPGRVAELRARGWLVQVNASSLTGRHGPVEAQVGWHLLELGEVDLVASDGHRASRPPYLDDAWRLAVRRFGEHATALFDGSALADLSVEPSTEDADWPAQPASPLR